MTDSAVIDLRDKANPPPDDPVKAPYGWRWDAKSKEWAVKRSAGGRKAGIAWFGRTTDEEGDIPESPEVRDHFAGLQSDPTQDPKPAWMDKPASKPRRAKPAAPKVNAKVKGDMSAAVGMIMMVTGPAIMAKDPYCGGAFFENSQKIVDAVIPLMCRSHTVVAFFSDSSENGWLLWFNLLIALSPVAIAIGKHHIIKSIEIKQDEETGDIYAAERDFSEYSA